MQDLGGTLNSFLTITRLSEKISFNPLGDEAIQNKIKCSFLSLTLSRPVNCKLRDTEIRKLGKMLREAKV